MKSTREEQHEGGGKKRSRAKTKKQVKRLLFIKIEDRSCVCVCVL